MANNWISVESLTANHFASAQSVLSAVYTAENRWNALKAHSIASISTEILFDLQLPIDADCTHTHNEHIHINCIPFHRAHRWLGSISWNKIHSQFKTFLRNWVNPLYNAIYFAKTIQIPNTKWVLINRTISNSSSRIRSDADDGN